MSSSSAAAASNLPPRPAMAATKDFPIRVLSRTLIQASDPPTSPPLHPISNLDLILHSFPISLISVYPPAPHAADFTSAAASLRAALPTFLNFFFPFAGRIRSDPSPAVPELVPNNAGAELLLAEVDLPLSALDFRDADRSLNRIQLPFASDLALALQLLRFSCGGFSLSLGTNHLLADGHSLSLLSTSLSEVVRTGSLSRLPNHDRSVFRPRSPPCYDPRLDREFVLYNPDHLINVLMGATLVRRNYRVDARHITRLRARASLGGRRATRLEAFSAHVWKLLAAAVGDADVSCRMAWLVEGRKRLAHKYKGAMEGYVGNVVTYASREARVVEVSRAPDAAVAAMVGDAIADVATEERYQQLVDWMEGKKGAGKWTELVGVGLGSPAVVVSTFVPLRVDADFGFGAPALVLPWLRPGRLGSASITVMKSPRREGDWIVNARLWPRLAEAMECDQEGVFEPLTAEILGLAAAPSAVEPVQASRL